MSAQDRAIQKLAKELAGIKREVVSWRGPQADYTSIENGGNFTFKDSDGNVTAVVGGQDDGSNTIRHVDGPTPPIPSGLSAHVDGPIVQVSWDGTFEDADTATHDWSHLEVIVAGPSNEQLTATINDVTGASTSVAATVSGEWDVVARSVSRAEKRSLDGDAGTVTVEIVGLSGAINDAIGSANGKNTVTYSEDAPTPADEGIAGDTWFVGSVADIPNPNNLAQNAEFNTLQYQRSDGMASASTGTTIDLSTDWFSSEPTSLKITPIASNNTTAVDQIMRDNPNTAVDAGKTFTIAADFHLESAQSGSTWGNARRIVVRSRVGSSNDYSFALSPQASNTAGTQRLKVTFTLPNNIHSWYFMLTNGSSTTPVYWDNITIEDGTTSGDYWQTNENGSWNIVEQYRHNGVVWKPVELNHEVISSVDLGKATVGELDGIRITGKSVRGEQLSGDAIDGKVITGGTYRTTGGTGSWSDDGLFIAQPDGTSMVRFPTDGSPLSLTASDVQIDRASITDLDLSHGAVRSGGQVTLASGVTAPASPPELTTGWQKVATLDKPDPGRAYDWTGLAAWGDKWVRTVNVLGEVDGVIDADTVEIYNEDGILERSFTIDNNPRHGVAVIGDVAYVLGPDRVPRPGAEKNWVHGFDLNTGERVSRWEFTDFAGGTNKLGIGTHGANLLVAGNNLNVSRRVHLLTFNPATGEKIGDTITTNEWVAYTKDIQGVHRDGNNLYMSHREATREFTLSGSTPTYTNNGWVNPNKNGAGLVWAESRPCVVDGAGNVYRGSNVASDITVQSCFTWWDGTHETTPSPVAEIVLPAQSNLNTTLPVRAGLQKRLYVNIGGWYWSVVDADQTVVYGFQWTGVGAPPTVNTFPNADPATLKSTNDKFVVHGDGSGSWGPLTFNADGTMSSSAVPAWVPVTTFAPNFSPGDFGYAPAYRIWPDGKVEWRGVVKRSSSSSDPEVVLTIPTAAIPAQYVPMWGARSGTTGMRFDVNDSTAPGKIRWQPDSACSWASLDMISYYTS